MSRQALLAMASGLVIGCISGYLYGVYTSEKQHQQEIMDLENEFQSFITELKESVEEDHTDDEVESSETREDPRPSIEYKPRPIKEGEEILYNGKPYVAEDDEESEDFIGYEDYMDRRMKELIDAREDSDIAYVIMLEEFDQLKDREGWESMTLTYYSVDETLSDDNQEPVVDPDYILGPDALKCFGVGSKDPDIVYVANNEIQILYEVIRKSEEYINMVLDYKETHNMD